VKDTQYSKGFVLIIVGRR